MTTLGLKAGDVVLLLERSGEQVLVHRALVVRCTMDPALVGLHGEAAIEAAYVQPPQEWPATESLPRLVFPVVHHTHPDWYRPYAQHFSYEELPQPPAGVCRFCGCTEQRACADGCGWLDRGETVCSAAPCMDAYEAEVDRLQAELLAEAV